MAATTSRSLCCLYLQITIGGSHVLCEPELSELKRALNQKRQNSCDDMTCKVWPLLRIIFKTLLVNSVPQNSIFLTKCKVATHHHQSFFSNKSVCCLIPRQDDHTDHIALSCYWVAKPTHLFTYWSFGCYHLTFWHNSSFSIELLCNEVFY